MTRGHQADVNSREEEAAAGGLEALVAAARKAGGGERPVHKWNPAYCGEMDMRIAADGTWFYQGTPIGRPALVRLFASILRKDPERHVLVTPVERIGIVVEDAPFVAVEMKVEGEGERRALGFRTNVDDWTIAGPDRPMRFGEDAAGGVKPYVLVRHDLWARLSRPLLYDLVELGEERRIDGADWFGVASRGAFFPIARADALAESR